MTILAFLLSVLGLAGAAYLLAAALAVRGFATAPKPWAVSVPPITVLKPLHGEDAELYANLRSFCEQRCPVLQIVFGVRDSADPALPTVRRLIADFPERDLELVVDPRVTGANFKVSNLENMLVRAKHPVLAIADSDMRVDPDYLAAVTAPLAAAENGLVTCLYRGRPIGGVASRLGAMFVNYAFLPSALVAERVRPGEAAFGATIALRRETLDAVGGFVPLRDQLADDYALGAAVRRLGKKIVLSRHLVDTVIAEPNLGGLFRHELRWARTIRGIAPLGYAGSIVTHALALAALGAILGGLAAANLGVLALVLLCRVLTIRAIGRALALPRDPLWLIPVRDLLSFLVFIASFLANTVAWRDHHFRVAANGRLVTNGDYRA